MRASFARPKPPLGGLVLVRSVWRARTTAFDDDTACTRAPACPLADGTGRRGTLVATTERLLCTLDSMAQWDDTLLGIGCRGQTELWVAATLYGALHDAGLTVHCVSPLPAPCPFDRLYRTVGEDGVVCVGGLLQTDPPERAKTATASSGCRPRPTAPDPGLSHGNSQEQATLGPTNAGEATGTPHRSTRAQARDIEARKQG